MITSEAAIRGYEHFGIDFDKMQPVDKTSDCVFHTSDAGVDFIAVPADGKVEFVGKDGNVLAYVKSELGFPCYYPLQPIVKPRRINAVLMDLDGTTVRSESFWIGIIQSTVRRLIGDPSFSFVKEDLPFVSGHSVSEHLQYCIDKYCPGKEIAEAREAYFDITHFEMNEIMQGRGTANAFEPNEGAKDFIEFLKDQGIKIGLVTSGLYEKAYPEILSAFKEMGMREKPEDYYDSMISAGYRLQKGSSGTLGELEAKPHPWLYAETYNVGLGIPYAERDTIIGIEDSGAGVYAIRLANVYTIGIAGGNIVSSGTDSICNKYCQSFSEIRKFICEINGID